MGTSNRIKIFKLDHRHSLKLFDLSDKHIAVAQNIRRSYGITEKNILNLIAFTGYVLNTGNRNNTVFNYSFIKEVSEFLPDADSIKTVTFAGEGKELNITNSEIAGKLLTSLLDIINDKSIANIKSSPDVQPWDENVKILARELYDELIKNEKLSPWRALSVVGYIFLLYELKLEKEEALLSEHEFLQESKNAGKSTSTYLNYLTDRIKNYIEN
jgi:hypothetical protein